MAFLTGAVKGANDLLPGESYINQYIENSLREIGRSFGFREIRTPVFEHTQLFTRSIGDTTDVVQKEMYTFDDNGGRSLTLKPEGTAPAARAFLEHGLFNDPLPQKVYYITPCYRYEKPQAGRLREFHQFGVECFGAASPEADAELIAMGRHIFDFFEIDNISLEINSIGCPECRKTYLDALRNYFGAYKGELCETCLGRLERNPMRILDCKSPICKKIAADAPRVTDYLCTDCGNHFDSVKASLDAMDIPYTVNPMIVRGLDYYTRTVFEFVSDDIGAQGTVLGGGRYDGLISELGGQPTPAAGFAMGLERLILLMKSQSKQFPEPAPTELFIATADDSARTAVLSLANELRCEGTAVVTDLCRRSVKAQMKYAGKLGASYVCVIGASELESGSARLKYMEDGSETTISIENFSEEFIRTELNRSLEQLGTAGDFDLFAPGV